MLSHFSHRALYHGGPSLRLRPLRHLIRTPMIVMPRLLLSAPQALRPRTRTPHRLPLIPPRLARHLALPRPPSRWLRCWPCWRRISITTVLRCTPALLRRARASAADSRPRLCWPRLMSTPLPTQQPPGLLQVPAAQQVPLQRKPEAHHSRISRFPQHQYPLPQRHVRRTGRPGHRRTLLRTQH